MSMNTKHTIPLTVTVTLVVTHDTLTGEIVDARVIDIEQKLNEAKRRKEES